MPGDFSDAGQHVLTPGHLLAQRYEVLSLLGEGGMGAVYKARDVELGRMVALKVIRPDLARNRAILDRFKQELILATQVTHRNVVRIYDLGEAEGIKFITMEYVEGEDLAHPHPSADQASAAGSSRDHRAGVPGARGRAQRGRHSP